MKKRLLTLALAVVLCLGLTAPASAKFALVEFEDSAAFGAWTWSAFHFYPLEGIDVSKQKGEFEKATGLTVFSEEVTAIGQSFTCYGLKDTSGKIILQDDFGEITCLKEGLLHVQRRRNNGEINWTGGLAQSIYTLSGEVVIAASEDNVGIQYGDPEHKTFLMINRSGYPIESDEDVHVFGRVRGLYDMSGNELLPAQYAIVDYMDDGYYRIQQGQKGSDGWTYWNYGVYIWCWHCNSASAGSWHFLSRF